MLEELQSQLSAISTGNQMHKLETDKLLAVAETKRSAAERKAEHMEEEMEEMRSALEQLLATQRSPGLGGRSANMLGTFDLTQSLSNLQAVRDTDKKRSNQSLLEAACSASALNMSQAPPMASQPGSLLHQAQMGQKAALTDLDGDSDACKASFRTLLTEIGQVVSLPQKIESALKQKLEVSLSFDCVMVIGCLCSLMCLGTVGKDSF